MAESPYPMLPVVDALAAVLGQCVPLPAVRMAVGDALGMVLAEDVAAVDPLPPFAAAVKDGYAVVAADGPGAYPVIGEATAGRIPEFRVEAGSVAYITTGAPLPAGANAVVMVEEVTPAQDVGGRRAVQIGVKVQPLQDVRPIGVDVAAGETVLRAGERLGPAEIGLLATVGVAHVSVVARPRVALLSTGDELVEAGVRPAPGQIRDSNRPMLAAAVAAAGGEVVDFGIAADDAEELARRVRQGLHGADVLVTSGGVSMGELDLIKPLLMQNATVHFGRLRMKPGKPCTFATTQVDGRRRLVFALPGNPVSSLVTFHLLVTPALRRLAGWTHPELTRLMAVLSQPLELDPARPEYHRAVLAWDGTLDEGRGGFVASSTGSQASSRLLSMRTANALLEIPEGQGTLAAGARVTALLIGEL